MKYQLFPNLTADEMDALTADITDRGVMVPVELDENGDILDGHHRAMIADSLGIEYPKVVRTGWSEDQKLVHVVALNVARRHLTAAERADVHRNLRERGMSLRAIAAATSVDAKTVRNDLAGGDFSPPAEVAGLDGKTYAATRPTPPKPRVDPNPDPYFAERIAAKEAHREAMALMPPLPDAERAAKADAWIKTIRSAVDTLQPVKAADYVDFLNATDREDTETWVGLLEDWIGWTRTALDTPLRLVKGNR